MVEFSTRFDTRREELNRICQKVKDQQLSRKRVMELVSLQKEEKVEFAMMVAEVRGSLFTTNKVRGEKGTVREDKVKEVIDQAESMRMTVSGAVPEKLHFFHTHPGGHPDFSVRDLIAALWMLGTEPQTSSMNVLSDGPIEGDIMLNSIEIKDKVPQKEIEGLIEYSYKAEEKFNEGEWGPREAKEMLREKMDGKFKSCSTFIVR